MKKLFFFILMMLSVVQLGAQTTKVRGRVLDSSTGEPVPFAGVFFEGTTVGITTDLDGYYSLEIRDTVPHLLVCQLLGYDVQKAKVSFGGFTTKNFNLVLTDNKLPGVVVKADNKRVKRLLGAIDSMKVKNNPNNYEGYSCDVYTRMEMDLTNPKEYLNGKRFMKEFGFVYDYLDTSSVSGMSYLPVMISETVAQRFHTSDPLLDKEIVSANRISGVNQDNNLLSQFSGSMYLKGDFYDDYVNVFGVDFPSPARKGGLFFYDYYIIDSLLVDNRKTYLVRYHPKPINEMAPILDGEMYVDAQSFALRRVKAKMVHGGNVNWIRDLRVEKEYVPVNDSMWFYASQKIYSDFSVALSDSSKLMSFLGNAQITYSNPKMPYSPAEVNTADRVKVDPDANYKDDTYWDSVRPYTLTEKEKGIYEMVDAIKDQPLYQDLYTIVYSLVTGFWDFSKFAGFGPYLQTISYNNVEGVRLQAGFHTTKDYSKKWRATIYGAYGIGDGKFKGGAKYERMFSKYPTSKLTLDAHYDMLQLGKGAGNFTQGNLLSSLWGNNRKTSPESSFSAVWEREFSTDFNFLASVRSRRIYGNEFVSMTAWNGLPLSSVSASELHLQARFSKDETVNRGHFEKTYLHSKYPKFYFDLYAGLPGLRAGDCCYIRPEVSMQYKFHVPPAGVAKLECNAGAIFGQVPYPLLYIHPGNVTGIHDKTAFSTMDFFEFASDRWAYLLYEHNFGGFLLSKIPLLRHAQLREVVTLKAAYGGLSDHNNGTDVRYGAVMPFPEGMKAMKVPYVEVGAGITNIFRIFRLQSFWRLTNLDGARRPFVVNFGVDMNF